MDKFPEAYHRAEKAGYFDSAETLADYIEGMKKLFDQSSLTRSQQLALDNIYKPFWERAKMKRRGIILFYYREIKTKKFYKVR